MIRLLSLVLIAVLAASCSEAEGQTFTRWRKNGMASDSTVFDLVAPDAPAGSFTSRTGNAVTFTRASTATCWDHGQTLVNLSANQVCAFGGKWLAEGASTNYVLRSEDLSNASWTKSAGISVIAGNGVMWVDGGNPMDTVAASAAASTAAVSQSVTVASQSYAGSVWFSTATDPGQTVSVVTKCNTKSVSVCKCAITGGQTCSAAIVSTNFCLATAAPPDGGIYRLQAKALCSSADTGSTLLLTIGTYGTSVPNDSIDFYGAQLEPLPVATSYVPTVAATATRAATSLSVSTTGWPGIPSAAVFDFTPTWDTESTLASGGAPEGDQHFLNTMSATAAGWGVGLTVTAGQHTPAISIRETVNDPLIGSAMTWAAGTKYRLRYEVAGLASGSAWTITRDGTTVSGLAPATKAQTADGVQQATAYIGSWNTFGSRYTWGWLGPKMCLASSTAGCQ